MGSARKGAVAGVTAAAAATLALLVVRAIAGGPSLTELVQDGIVGALPGQVFSFALDRLRFAGKPLLFTLILLGQLGVGAAVGALYARRPRTPHSAALLGGSIYVVLLLVVLPLLGAGFLGMQRTADVPIWLSTLVAVVVFAAVLHVATRATLAPDAAEAPDADRRRFIRLAATGGSLAAVGVIGWRALALLPQGQAPATTSTTSNAGPPTPLGGPLGGAPTSTAEPAPGDDHPTPDITPPAQFYTVSKNFVDPHVPAEGWKVSIGGMVDKPYALTLDQLKALPPVEQPATLMCISNEVGGDLIGNAIWKGVRLKDILNQAGIQSGAKKVVWTCRDDYRDSITMDRALQDGTILVYEMDGQPLADKHGFPARVIVPGIYGMKNAKWLEKIDVVADDFRGYWQEQGWSDPAPYQTMSRIDRPIDGELAAPGKMTLYGVAFAGDRGISKVELSFDKGTTWQDAQLRKAMGPFTWVRWSFDWTAPPSADVRAMVRATDGKGVLQTSEDNEAFPDGSTGYHYVRIRTRAA